jgi:hypothetical protein
MTKNIWLVIAALIVGIAIGLYAHRITTPTATYQEIGSQMAQDAIDRYHMAERNGDRQQMYYQSGIAYNIYLQMKDEPNYRKWRDVEYKLSRVMGMPEFMYPKKDE